MKKFILIPSLMLATLTLAPTIGSAEKERVKTTLTCEQDEGDEWLEAGIARNAHGKGYRLLVVLHDAQGDGSEKLIYDGDVFRSRVDGKTVYENSWKDAKLTVYKKNLRSKVRYGDLGVLKENPEGPGSFMVNGLFCYPRGSISFDREE